MLKEYDLIMGSEVDLILKDDSNEDTSDRWSPEYRLMSYCIIQI